MTDVLIGHCFHPDSGLAWLMQPLTHGEVRRVKLCSCGRTHAARLTLSGAQGFDNLALTVQMYQRPVLEVVTP